VPEQLLLILVVLVGVLLYVNVAHFEAQQVRNRRPARAASTKKAVKKAPAKKAPAKKAPAKKAVKKTAAKKKSAAKRPAANKKAPAKKTAKKATAKKAPAKKVVKKAPAKRAVKKAPAKKSAAKKPTTTQTTAAPTNTVASSIAAGVQQAANANPLVIAVPTEPSTLDPQLVNDRSTRVVTSSMFETLLFRDKKNKVQPLLAESYSLANPTTWRFVLRKGVTFHNGEPMPSPRP